MEKRQELWDAGSRANKENKKIAFAHPVSTHKSQTISGEASYILCYGQCS